MSSVLENCPWYDLYQYWGPPTVDWCEAATCSHLVNPSLALSNISYLIISVLIMNNSKEKLGKLMGITVFIIGCLSFVYHSMENFLGQYFDFLGIFLLCSFVFLMTIKSEYPKSGKRKTLFFFLLINGIFFLIKELELPIQLSLAPPFLMAAYFEYPVMKLKGYKSKNLYMAILWCWGQWRVY